MNISLPKPLKRWIDLQVEQKGYGTASEFIRELVREKRAVEEAKSTVEAKLVRAIESGPSTLMTSKDWAKLRRNGLKRLRAAKSKRA